jgi:hypothetical protein
MWTHVYILTGWALERGLMEIELRRTTENDLPYVLSAESDDDSSRFIAVWPADPRLSPRVQAEANIITPSSEAAMQ